MGGNERDVELAVSDLERFLELAQTSGGTPAERELAENISLLLQALRREQQRLKAARIEVDTLRRLLLPTCMYCKKIRNDGGEWNELERAISAYGIHFSHTICPNCMVENHPEAADGRLHFSGREQRY